MDIKTLQGAWNALSASDVEASVLTEEKIKGLLSRRTVTLLDRIDKNIRWSLVLVVLFIGFTYLGELFWVNGNDNLSPMMDRLPLWLIVLNHAINFLTILLFVLLAVNYRRAIRKCNENTDLRSVLERMIRILHVYRRFFVLALVVFMMAFAVGFIAGFYDGLNNGPAAIKSWYVDLIAIGILILFSVLIYLLLRWLFRRLYGNHLRKLTATLKELDELDGNE